MITHIGINGRDDIPRFLNEEKLTGVGVEIGTHRGDYALTILNTWRGTLYCIDPWDNYDDVQVSYLSGGTDRKEHKAEADRKLMPYMLNDRCRMLALTSQDAVQFFSDESLD